MRGYVKTYAIDMNTFRTREDGTHSQTGLFIIIIIPPQCRGYAKTYAIYVIKSCASKEGAHTPSWPNGLIIIIIIICINNNSKKDSNDSKDSNIDRGVASEGHQPDGLVRPAPVITTTRWRLDRWQQDRWRLDRWQQVT